MTLLAWTIGADTPVRLLAVIGGFFLGALFLGWMVQVACALLFRQTLPRGPLWIFRVGGGLLSAWIVALIVFGGGGSGIGGVGGTDFGSGSLSDSEKSGSPLDKDNKDDPKKPPEEKTDPTTLTDKEIVQVEVLGDAPLKKLAKASSFDANKRYRIPGEPQLYTLDEVRKRIRQAREQSPPLRRLEVILYQDSPDSQRPQVTGLVEWANDLEGKDKPRLRVDFVVRDREAPLD